MNDARREEIFYKVKDRYVQFLSVVLWKLSGDREQFTEAMQYALLGMWEHVSKLNGPRAQAYIYRIALSANAKAWRHRVGRNGHDLPEWLVTEGRPEDKLDREILMARVRHAIAKLPTRQSRAVVMRYLEQLDYQEVAARLGCNQVVARSHVSKALTALRHKLALLQTSEVSHD